jgi:putative GTP pyrophosphokinase
MLLFMRDVPRVCELISKTFVVVSQEDAAQRLAAAEFGYQSLHYIIKLPQQWLSVPSFRGFEDLRAELQVRTVAQHIWAAASHILQYKQEASVPLPVRRSISRVSALLETVDLEFERVLAERETYVSKLRVHDASEPLNVDLLKSILDELLPANNRWHDDDYSELVDDLNEFKITDAEKVRELIEKHLPAALEDEASEVARIRERLEKRETLPPGISGASPSAVMRRLRKVYFTHVDLIRMMLRSEFGERWEDWSSRKYHYRATRKPR